MNSKFYFWFKTGLIIAFLLIAGYLVPDSPLTSWNLFSPRKLVNMILALVLIQALGTILIRPLGHRAGAIITGFLGGLISSTMMTASIARKSATLSEKETVTESLGFLSATFAMLLEALIITMIGTNYSPQLLIIFLGPVVVTIALIVAQSRKPHGHPADSNKNPQLEILPILKLSFFILLILALSKVLQKVFGQSGLLVLTFLVSLFEIHGSFIANTQLYTSGEVSIRFLGSLLTISLAASYISKLFLVFAIGGSTLKRLTVVWTGVIVLSLLLSWIIFYFPL